MYKKAKNSYKGGSMEKKVIITAALVGSRPTKEMNPAVPYTPEEIVKSAVECHKAGASIVHIHVRDPKTGTPDFKVELFKAVLDGIRSKCNLLVNLTTSALFLTGPDVIAQRLQPVYLKPDLGSFDLGSMNFQDRAFTNPPEFSEAATKCMKENKVKPEIEVFDVGHIYQAIDLIQRGLIVDPPYFQLCMGVRWGMDAITGKPHLHEGQTTSQGGLECPWSGKASTSYDYDGHALRRPCSGRLRGQSLYKTRGSCQKQCSDGGDGCGFGCSFGTRSRYSGRSPPDSGDLTRQLHIFADR